MTRTKRSDRRACYVSTTIAVVDSVVDQEYDLKAALVAKGGYEGARYMKLSSDLAISFKINSTSGDSIALGTTTLVFDDTITISKLYFSHIGAASGSGDATVTLLAI